MKKGSRIKKCSCCGKKICYIVPDGELLGLRIMKTVDIEKWVLRENKCWCVECYEKHKGDMTK